MNSLNTFAFMMELAVKATVMLGAAYLLTKCLGRQSAPVRHLVWSLTFGGLLLLPLFALVLPSLSFPVSTAFELPIPLFRAAAKAGDVIASGSGRQGITVAGISRLEWPGLLIVIWVTGTIIFVSRMLSGWLKARRLCRDAQIFDTLTLEGRGSVLLEAPDGTMPMTAGIFRPKILLPADARHWSENRLRVVILHELAHLRRGDVITHVLARFTLSLHWWNPMAWAAWREFLKEQEHAADDAVLRAGEASSNYARELVEIAQSLRARSDLDCSAVAMASPSQLEGRVRAILATGRNRNTLRPGVAWLAAGVAILLTVPLAAMSSLTAVQEAKAGNGTVAMELIHQGTTELGLKEYAAATRHFQKAKAGDGPERAEASMWLAVVQQSQDNVDAALALYKSAVAEANPHELQTAVTMDLYAQLLQKRKEEEAAAKLRRQASEIRGELAVRAKASHLLEPDAFRVGKEVRSPVLKSKVEPDYDEAAKLARLSGTVLIQTEIDTNGNTQNVEVIRPLGLGLDEKAVDAVKQWKFQPGTKDGVAVKVAATIEVQFRLL